MSHIPSAYQGPGAFRRWETIRALILRRDMHSCRYCGAHATTVDHVTPRIEGGTDDPSNLVAACVRCNALRSVAWNREHRPWARKGGSIRRKRRTPPTGTLAS